MGIFDIFKKKDDPGASPGESSASKQPTFMERLRGALKKTKDVLNTDIRDLFKSEGRLVEEPFLDDLFAILVRTDMGVLAATEISRSRGPRLPRPHGPHAGYSGHDQGQDSRADGAVGRADPLRGQRADGDSGRRRERLREDDVDRQARPPPEADRGQDRSCSVPATPSARRRWSSSRSGRIALGVRIVKASPAATRPAWPIGPWPRR